MTPRPILAAGLMLLSAAAFAQSAASFASTESQFASSAAPVFAAASDGRYKLTEKRANETLDILKTLRGYAGDVKDASEKLRKEMLGSRYDDMVNTQLMPALFDARATAETLDKTYDLEKGNVKDGLKAAKGGDYASIDAALSRIAAFEADYEARTKATEARVNEVRAAYGRDFGNAKNALAQFQKIALIQELLAAKPKLVKKIELQATSLRPLQWTVVLQKEQKDSNDPRLAQIPRTISVLDGASSISYPVVVR